MKTKSEIQKLIAEALQKAFSTAVPAGEIHLEHPADRSHGDWATNVAMTLTKDLGQNPRQIAEQLVAAFPQNEIVEKVEVAGPGFINFYINPGLYKTLLSQIDDKYGYHKLMVGKTLMIEFGQPNTHKEFHVGHLKSAISGLAISNMMEALGYKVLRVNYFGDVGLQVAKSTWGFMQKDRPGDFENWDVHKKMKYVDECYVFGSQQMKEDPKVEAEIREINKQVYARASTPAVEVYGQIREWSIEHVNLVFAKLGVVYDRQYPESEVDAEAVKIVKEHIGEIFVESEEAIIYDGKQEGLTTWVFITKEGLPTYSAKDLALAYKKFAEYNPDLSIVTTSVEQRDYFKVVIRALERIDSKFVGKYMNLPFGWLLRNNKKASSRMGENVKGVDILHEAEELAIQKIKVDKSYDAQEKARIAELISLAGLKFL
ncbi:arginine--tRNA ligase, partial [Candidatus Dojkabacteria bacterium]|nr:arginine--tRNA ligase [Candidatus Dojkabacteria bacterium]